MKYYIIAGEASGDLHGSNLMAALKTQDPQADFRFWGGDKMIQQDSNIVKHIRDLAFMGFVEVIKHLGTILNNIKLCKQDILKYRPDALVLIDYPGFNMRIAKWAKQQGIKVIYYISPQLWAWKENRVKAIKRDVDKMIVILPFEKEFYKRHNLTVDYVGHPLTDVIKSALKNDNNTAIEQKPFIALLPGSRKQEISTKLPIMLSIVEHFPSFDFLIMKAPSIDEDFYNNYIKNNDSVKLVTDSEYNIRKKAVAALVTSGTATLETALLKVPQIVCYKGNKLSYMIARRLIKVKYISLVNLILDKPAVKELIQDELNTEQLIQQLNLLLYDEEHKVRLQRDYEELWSILNIDNASQNAARIIIETIS